MWKFFTNTGSEKKITASIISPEVSRYESTSNAGPTAVTTTGNGDALYDMPTCTVGAVRHYWELSGQVQCDTANTTIWLRLHEGTNAALGALVAETQIRNQNAGVPRDFFLRIPFTPTAGTRGYCLRWRGVSGNYTLYNSIIPLVSRIVVA